jgi:predicted RNA-binding Zn-ribbon protein involved in translation (DUF1610 family)
MTNWTATNRKPCDHSNGWYVSVKFWIFRKVVYVCSDCGEVIEREQK